MSYDEFSHRLIPDDTDLSDFYSYEQFKNGIVSAFEEKYGAEGEVIVNEVPKNNGTTQDGLFVHYPELNIAPTFYLDEYYSFYKENGWEKTLNILFEQQEIYHISENFNLDFLSDYEYVKKHLTIRLVNCLENHELLNDVPWLPLEDLAIMCCCTITENSLPNQKNGSVIIHKEMLKQWEITEKELFSDALESAPLIAPAHLETLDHVIQTIMKEIRTSDQNHLPEEFFTEPDHTPEDIYVAGNVYDHYGASVICYPYLLHDIAEEFADDLLIIPSSVHEVMITRKHSDYFVNINDTIKEVNASEVAKSEILSDHAYLYLKEEERLISL